MYLETAQRLKQQQDRQGEAAGPVSPEVQALDFESVLFASAIVDYDYIMALIARSTEQPPGRLTLNREQLIGLIQSDAKFLDEREDIAEYIRGLPVGQALDEKAIRTAMSASKPKRRPGRRPPSPAGTGWRRMRCRPLSTKCCAAASSTANA